MWSLCICDKKTIFVRLWREKDSKGFLVLYLTLKTLLVTFFSFSIPAIFCSKKYQILFFLITWNLKHPSVLA